MYVRQECKAFIILSYKSEKNMLSVNKFHSYISYTPEIILFYSENSDKFYECIVLIREETKS